MQGPSQSLPLWLTDLEDMSLMVLRTQGPAALFDDHKLILHTSSYDAGRARVFHVCGELVPGAQPGQPPLPPCLLLQLQEVPWVGGCGWRGHREDSHK